ncbi:MAG TPA: hypothetical protein VGF02_03185, partial [Pseudolabrys sp.]
AKKARKKPAGSRKKRMSKSGKALHKAAATKTPRKTMTKARRKPAMAKKPASAPVRRRKHDPETTVNALVLLVLIMIALGSAYLYLQHQPAGAAIAPPASSAMEKK